MIGGEGLIKCVKDITYITCLTTCTTDSVINTRHEILKKIGEGGSGCGDNLNNRKICMLNKSKRSVGLMG